MDADKQLETAKKIVDSYVNLDAHTREGKYAGALAILASHDEEVAIDARIKAFEDHRKSEGECTEEGLDNYIASLKKARAELIRPNPPRKNGAVLVGLSK